MAYFCVFRVAAALCAWFRHQIIQRQVGYLVIRPCRTCAFTAMTVSTAPAGPVVGRRKPFFARQGRLARWWDRPLCLSMGEIGAARSLRRAATRRSQVGLPQPQDSHVASLLGMTVLGQLS